MNSRFKESSDVSDLKAFERRLTEVIGCLQPATMRWRSKLQLMYLILCKSPSSP